MFWKSGALALVALTAVVFAEPTPFEQLVLTLAGVLIAGLIFHLVTVWRIRRILDGRPEKE